VHLLVRYFVQKISRRQNKTVEYVPSDVMDALVNYSWPGNVRELENLLERAVLLSPGKGLQVPVSELKSRAMSSGRSSATNESAGIIPLPIQQLLPTLPSTRYLKRRNANTSCGYFGKRSGVYPPQVRQTLGIKRTTLQARMQTRHKAPHLRRFEYSNGGCLTWQDA
jgi:transcriptional regulator with PAS, ATPase and Fis domain